MAQVIKSNRPGQQRTQFNAGGAPQVQTQAVQSPPFSGGSGPGSNFQQNTPYIPPSSAVTQNNPASFSQANVLERTLGGPELQSSMGFITANRGRAQEAMREGMTNESELAQALRGGAGQSILDRLGMTADNAAVRRNLTNAQLDRALNRNLASARRQFAGTGLAGTSQGGRSVGELLGQAQQANVDAEMQLQDQSLKELLGLTDAAGSIQQQEVGSRNQKFLQQAQLANLLNSQAASEINRQSGLASNQPGGPSLLEAFLINNVATGAGAFTKSAGSTLGSGIGPGGGF